MSGISLSIYKRRIDLYKHAFNQVSLYLKYFYVMGKLNKISPRRPATPTGCISARWVYCRISEATPKGDVPRKLEQFFPRYYN